MTSFMAQNSGAGKKDRVRKGFWGGMKIEMVYGMVIFLVCFFFAEPVVRLFVSDTDVIKEGVTYLKLILCICSRQLRMAYRDISGESEI
jgi:Na+-driven multidrug efflux pump